MIDIKYWEMSPPVYFILLYTDLILEITNAVKHYLFKKRNSATVPKIVGFFQQVETGVGNTRTGRFLQAAAIARTWKTACIT